MDDNADDLQIAREYLKASEWNVQLAIAEDLQSALNVLGTRPVQIGLLDLGLPDSDGTATLKTVVDRTPNVPIVVLTGLADESSAIESLQQGAQDDLIKDHATPEMPSRAIRSAANACWTESA